MSAIPEPLSGGLVTARDPSLLQEGELAVAEDVMLKPGSTSLHKAPGRSKFNSTPVGTIGGIGYADFETAADKIIVTDGGLFKTASAGLTGSFSALTTAAGSTLEVVVLDDRAVLLSGATTSNNVLLNDGTERPHGMLPVTTGPGAVVTATGGAWGPGSTGLGSYEYWTTEVYKVGEGAKAGQEEVEGTFSGKPATVTITAVANYVTITAPEVVNPNATHWRTYRSERKTNVGDQAFPVGWLVGEAPILQRTMNDGFATVGTLTLPTAASAPTTISFPASPFYGHTVSAWANPNNALTDNATNATSASVSTSGSNRTISQLLLQTFGFTGIIPPVTDITVQVDGIRTNSDAICVALLSWDGGTHWTDAKTVPLTTSQSIVSIVGGDWGRTWADTDFTDANFRVLLVAYNRSSVGTTVGVDFVKVALTHNGSSAGLVTQFPNTILRISNESIPVGSNGHPPRATTGDIFQGSLLTNDVDNPTEVSWTIPGTIDYSPEPYSLVIGDTVRCIRTVGTASVIGCAGVKVRMNYLPVAEDPEFNTGRAVETFDPDDGVVSYRGIVKFVLSGEPMLFCVGNNSLKITNGYTTTSATDDIIWTDLANTSQLTLAHAENNAHHHEILVHFPAAGSSTVNKTLRLSYHPTHLKGGKLKVSGITNYGPSASVTGIASTGERRSYTVVGGTVYVENQGFSDASGGTIVPTFETREMHQAKLGNSWEMGNLGIHHQGGGSTLDVSSKAALSNYPVEPTSAKSVPLTARMLSLVDNSHAGDGITVRAVGRDDGLPLTVDYLVLFAEGLGETAPLKQ